MDQELQNITDIAAEVLPPELLAEFLDWFKEPAYSGGGDNADGGCGRCGSTVAWSRWETHKAWHRNLSLQVWLLGKWVAQQGSGR